jgi:hypothetical protein
MGDDADEVTAVLEMLLPLVRACTGLVAGGPTELGKRGEAGGCSSCCRPSRARSR